MILFDINYRICLDFPYPYGLDDCWQAYHWILNYCEVILRMKPQKIILVGESMGGNLALGNLLIILGLTIHLIRHKQRIPDRILLFYPVMELD